MKKLFVLIALVVVVAACAGSGSTAGNGGTSEANALVPNQQGTGQTGRGSTGVPDAGNDATKLPGESVPILQGPPVIRQAQMTITVGNGLFDSKLLEVRTLVQAQGGYIAGTEAQAKPINEQDPGQMRTGVMSFMVPAAHFDTAIDQLSKVGKVQAEHITGTDVSAQYVDLRARLANAEAQRDAMLVLLRSAKTISDIIAVQNQIGQITGQIEQLKGQIKYLDDNTSYSSVSVTLMESGAPLRSPSADSWGFVSALNMAAHNFVSTINYVITALGAVGPLLVLLLLGYLVWRSRRRTSPVVRNA